MLSIFDEYIDRKGSDSRKWDVGSMLEMSCYSDEESIPMWVADMDFKAPEIVIRKLEERVNHGVFGYNTVGDSYCDSVKYWLKKRNDWDVELEWIVPTTGVVPALCYAVRAFTEAWDGVVVQNPVYPPFRGSIEINDRKVINNSLKFVDGKYEMDFEDLEVKLKHPTTKMMIICSPHNPIGRVWTKEELKKVIDLCVENDIILVSDEIHSDLILFDNKFETVGKVDKRILDRLVVCTSVSKTFNLAGLKGSNIIIPSRNLREKFVNEIYKVGGKIVPNLFAAMAVEAVYTPEGEKWLKELKMYLEGNYKLLTKFIDENCPNVKYGKLEGTYLAWIDLRESTAGSYEEIKEKIEKKAKIVIDGGEIFGEEGRGFIRLNFGCNRKILELALSRLKNIIGK